MFYRISLFAAILFLTSCTAPGALLHCADGLLPRVVTKKSYEVDVYNGIGLPVASSTIVCEKYYDTDCSVRGNRYAYRRLTPYEGPIELPERNGDKLELTFPSCRSLMEHSDIHPSHFGRVYIDATNGEKYGRIFYYGAGVMGDGKKGFMFHNTKGEPVWLGDPFTAQKREVVSSKVEE